MYKKSTTNICKECGEKFKISFLLDLISHHNTDSKYIKCPDCSKRSWNKDYI